MKNKNNSILYSAIVIVIVLISVISGKVGGNKDNNDSTTQQITTEAVTTEEITTQTIENLTIFDKTYNIKDQLTVIAQSISAGFSYGNVTVFRKSGETFEILHIKCFVNSNNGEEYGAFEIFTIDKNDKKEIVEKTQSWWDKAKGAIIKATEIIKCIGGAISAF